jgi:hypothetical protein
MATPSPNTATALKALMLRPFRDPTVKLLYIKMSLPSGDERHVKPWSSIGLPTCPALSEAAIAALRGDVLQRSSHMIDGQPVCRFSVQGQPAETGDGWGGNAKAVSHVPLANG